MLGAEEEIKGALWPIREPTPLSLWGAGTEKKVVSWHGAARAVPRRRDEKYNKTPPPLYFLIPPENAEVIDPLFSRLRNPFPSYSVFVIRQVPGIAIL